MLLFCQNTPRPLPLACSARLHGHARARQSRPHIRFLTAPAFRTLATSAPPPGRRAPAFSWFLDKFIPYVCESLNWPTTYQPSSRVGPISEPFEGEISIPSRQNGLPRLAILESFSVANQHNAAGLISSFYHHPAQLSSQRLLIFAAISA